MKKLGIGLVGCGGVFNAHVNYIAADPDATIVQVADIKPERAKAAGEKLQCAYTTNWEDLLQNDRIDIVHLTTPHYLHSPHAIAFLNAGKHVLQEKPMAENLQAAIRTLECVRTAKPYFGVCFQNRFNTPSVFVKKAVEEGTYGKVLGVKGLVTWHRFREYYTESGWRGTFETEGAGVLINQSIHTLDLLRYLVGDTIVGIQGNIATRTLSEWIEVEDTADCTLFFKNGGRGHLLRHQQLRGRFSGGDRGRL